MRNYDGWSFRDRAFLWALVVSVLWHFFWFFSITIVVSPPKPKKKPMVKIVSIGPVLDDSIFRTLVDTRPQLSQTFYRNVSQLPASLEPQAPTIERRSPGEVVSVPFGRRFLDSVRALVGGDKSSPETDLSAHLGTGYPLEDDRLWEEPR